MNKRIQQSLMSGALVLALTACGGQNVKPDAPEAETTSAAAPADNQAATAEAAPVVKDSLASSTFPDGEPAAPGPKGHTTSDVKLQSPHQPSADLKERALERWALLIANRGAEAFQYLTPGYRSNKTAEQYGAEMGARPVRWKELGVNSVTCQDDDSCEVSLWSESEVKLSVAMGSNSVFGGHLEEWLKIDGVWYYLPNH